jgi:hypothetical protein
VIDLLLIALLLLADADTGRVTTEGYRVWSWSCPYRKEAKCHAKCRKERHAATSSTPLFWVAQHSSGCSHVDHSQRVQADETKKQWKQGTKRKVGLFQREVLLSPSKTKMPFKKVRRELRAKGIVVDKSNNSAFQQAHRQAKDDKFKSDTGCEVKDKNKIGALMCLLEEHSYDTKKDSAGSDFSEDTTYVMNGWKIDVQTQYIAFLVTTDKLLRNIYLQAKSGAPSYIAVDCTHRLVNKGHACIVFGTMDLEQKFHKVAYGMISTKGQGCHEHCFEMLIDAVNAQATRENLPAVN